MAVNSRILVAISLGVVAAVVAAAGAAFIGQGSDFYSNEAEDTLVFTHVMFRHGNRTPHKPTFPTDQYSDHSFSPIGWGELTNGGKARSYENGKYLRHRYGRFLGDVLDDAVMQLKSTDTARTKNTASLVGAGLWPPADRWDDGTGSKSNPVPTEVLSKQDDNLLHLYRAPCPAYKTEYNRLLSSQDFRDIVDSFSELRLYLSKHTGMDVQTPRQGNTIFQALVGQKEFGLELPEWAERILPELEPFALWNLRLNAYNEKLQKLRSGVVIREINANNIAVATKSLKPAGRKIVLYSAHESTMVSFLLALGLFNNQIPPFGAMVMIELHRIPGAVRRNAAQEYKGAIEPYIKDESVKNLNQYGVKMFLRNSTWHDPYPLTLPNCDFLCPLDRFVHLTSHTVIHDWQAECFGEASSS